MAKRLALVTTTIFVPNALRAYMQNVKENKHEDVFFVVTGDKKTPAEAKPFCEEISKEFGIECVYQTVEDQIAWLERFPELRDEIPWNCIQRRNVAILTAYERGAEVIITIDDDNFFVEGQDFIGDHAALILQGEHEMETLSSNTGWLNVCSFLEDKRGYEYYPRGYPMDQRWPKSPVFNRSSKQSRKVVVNAGLWLDDPDVDAITRLCNDISAVRYTREANFAMARGTWCPFNSQNTALAREMVPSYCLSPNIGRYDDIWASYIVLAIADHLDHSVCFGYPLVKQERNPHNYFKDHLAERVGLEHTHVLCRCLRHVRLTGKTYLECTVEIVEALTRILDSPAAAAEAGMDGPVPGEMEAHVRGMLKSYRAWIATMRRLGL